MPFLIYIVWENDQSKLYSDLTLLFKKDWPIIIFRTAVSFTIDQHDHKRICQYHLKDKAFNT